MFRKFLPLIIIGLWGAVVLPIQNRASANTPLTKAQIQDLRNLVQLMPQNQPKRQAQKRDAMIPGDGLSTGRSSLADLRFNDGSLARIGEQALFKFLPKTRNFQLSHGTVLLLIPPGRGQTHINTPNAAAAIRGSALFVRYDQQTDTTVVGALTNSGIQVFNNNASQHQMLQAGQLMVVVKGKFQGLYDFDLRTFYQTSDLVKGFDLTKSSTQVNPDPAIAQVQAETAAAVKAQSPINGKGVVENPSFLNQRPSTSNLPRQEINEKSSPVQNLLETGEIQSPVNNTGNVKDSIPTGNNRNNITNGSNLGSGSIQPAENPTQQQTGTTPILPTSPPPPISTTGPSTSYPNSNGSLVTPTSSTPPITLPTSSTPPITLPTSSTPPITLPTSSTPPITLPTSSTPPTTLPTSSTPPITLPTSSTPPITLPTSSTPPITLPTSSTSPITLPTSSTSPLIPITPTTSTIPLTPSSSTTPILPITPSSSTTPITPITPSSSTTPITPITPNTSTTPITPITPNTPPPPPSGPGSHPRPTLLPTSAPVNSLTTQILKGQIKHLRPYS
jgi:hypothetical protein